MEREKLTPVFVYGFVNMLYARLGYHKLLTVVVRLWVALPLELLPEKPHPHYILIPLFIGKTNKNGDKILPSSPFLHGFPLEN